MALSHNKMIKFSSKLTPEFYKPEQLIRLRNIYLNLRV